MPILLLKYPEILNLFGVHAMKQRTESRAFLAWFLENYYRLDRMEVDDCICDGKQDKGIDGIYVTDQIGQIDIFQSWLVQGKRSSLGDSMLKEFVGTLSQFKDKASIESLQTTSGNPELASLLKRYHVADKVAEGFVVRGVFLTNVARDQNATMFLSQHSEITVYDKDELERAYAPLDKTAPIAKEVSFNIAGAPHMEYQLSRTVNMVIASLPASELLKMDGIANGELFAWNVRQWQGRKTPVNKDIEKSIRNATEHQLFPAFHNGLTILCKTLTVGGDKIKISGYAVVNGCQSLTSLNENRRDITPDLRVITKFLNVPPDDELAEKITDRTNNQNGVTSRDRQSNNPIQVRLQSEIHRLYAGHVYYRIKSGENPEWPREKVIENELAARVLLAFDLKEPFSCHQRYKLFDELHPKIFGRPEVNADRIVLAIDLHDVVVTFANRMQNELFGKYILTRYLICYLVKEALQTDDVGKRLCVNPSAFLHGEGSRKRVKESLEKIVDPIVTLLDTEVDRRSSQNDQDSVAFFDYKNELKSKHTVADIRQAIISHFQIVIRNKYSPTFAEAWAASGKTKKKATRTK